MNKYVLIRVLLVLFIGLNIIYGQSLGIIYPFDDSEKDIEFSNFFSKLK